MTDRQKQCLLAYLGYYGGAIDGIWGDQSRAATEAFQRAWQLTADGTFGEETEKRLREVIASGETPPEDSFWEHIRYWSREEFKCRCAEYHAPYCGGYPAEPDRTLVELADDIRHDLGAPGIRSSGLRCRRHNADSGGVSNSRHLSGKALDFMIQGVSAQRLYQRAKADPRTRYTYIIGDGPYVHVDVE